MRYASVAHMFLCLGFLSMGACQTIHSDDDSLFHIPVNKAYLSSEFEEAELLATPLFIEDDCNLNCPYVLHDQTYNDGLSNHYKVTYGDHIYVSQGTLETQELIKEVKATSALKQTKSMNVAANSVKERTTQLVTTPYEVGSSIYNRYDRAENLGEALLIAPKGALVMTSKLLTGAKELGVTGRRLTENASHTSCGLFECFKKLGEDIWYAVNLLTGKHGDAKVLHSQQNTNPETQNPLLKREVNRISYISSLTSSGYKFGLGAIGIPVISDTSTVIGYYRNAEFLSGYEDARKLETSHKRKLRSLQIEDRTISRLYGNEAFTRPNRNAVVGALLDLEQGAALGSMIANLSKIENRYEAQRWAAQYAYAQEIDQRDDILQLQPISNGLAVKTRSGQTYYLLAGDYIRWTEDLSVTLNKLKSEQAWLQVHFLGQTSETARYHADRLGIAMRVI